MKILEARSIPSAIDQTIQHARTWASDHPPYLWFRGESDDRYKLTPRAYRQSDYVETETLIDFAQLGAAISNIGPPYSWETYYLAQHHGIPTRLLDWTESFSAALFFAFRNWTGKTRPCVWMMQPSQFNHVFLGWKGVLAPEHYPNLSAWLANRVEHEPRLVTSDNQGFRYDNDWPLAIYPRKSNQRIAAQQGTFTIHGRERGDLVQLVKNMRSNPAEVFAKISFVRIKKHDALRDLSLLGVRQSAVFPDLDNLVEELKNRLNWN